MVVNCDYLVQKGCTVVIYTNLEVWEGKREFCFCFCVFLFSLITDNHQLSSTSINNTVLACIWHVRLYGGSVKTFQTCDWAVKRGLSITSVDVWVHCVCSLHSVASNWYDCKSGWFGSGQCDIVFSTLQLLNDVCKKQVWASFFMRELY